MLQPGNTHNAATEQDLGVSSRESGTALNPHNNQTATQSPKTSHPAPLGALLDLKNAAWERDGTARRLSIQHLRTSVACASTAYGPTTRVDGIASTTALFGQTYGPFEACIRRAGEVSGGFNENVWPFPDDRYTQWNWPAAGELDPVAAVFVVPEPQLPGDA